MKKTLYSLFFGTLLLCQQAAAQTVMQYNNGPYQHTITIPRAGGTYTPDRPAAPSSYTPEKKTSYTTPADNAPTTKSESKPVVEPFHALPAPENGYAEYSYSAEIKYKGNFKNGQRSGTGVLTIKDKTEYDGEWANDLFNGKGTLHLSYGVYEGNFVNGYMSGHGILTENGENFTSVVYDGEWVNGHENGYGTLTDLKEKYAGYFANDAKNGKGTLTVLKHGDVYEGTFVNGNIDGFGTYYDGYSQAKYTGNFKVGSRNGKGVMVWPSGERMEGTWKNDEMDGYGISTWANGVRYEGQWVAGQREGHGVCTDANGTKYDGEWIANRRNGHGVLDSAGIKYDGEWLNGTKALNPERPKADKIIDPNDPVLIDLKKIMESATHGFADAKGKRKEKHPSAKDIEKTFSSLLSVSCATYNGTITDAYVYALSNYAQFKEEVSFSNTTDRDNYLQLLGAALPPGTGKSGYGWDEAYMPGYGYIKLQFNTLSDKGVTISIVCLQCYGK